MSEETPFAGELREQRAEGGADRFVLRRLGHPGPGRLWMIGRVGCLALMLVVLVPFAASIPLRWRQLAGTAEPASIFGLPPALEAGYTSRLGPAEAAAWQSLGLSQDLYAAYVLSFEVALAVVCTLVGLFIFWRSAEGWLTLWTATVLVMLGVGSVAPELPTLSILWPGWWSLFVAVGMVGMVSNLHLLFLAPDGRFVPRWAGPLAAGFTGAMLALGFYTFAVALDWGPLGGMVGILIAAPAWYALLGLGILSQVYRYRHVSGPVQRQQIKWVAVGLAAVTLGILINAALLIAGGTFTAGLARVWCNLARVTLVYLCLMALPICLAFSILRYRLWDIDVLIRRTLIYSSLTAALVVIYSTCIVLLQALFQAATGERQSQFVTIVSTLAIVALFGRLARRIQDFIDRRFFRRKYDAARTLASFAASVRDETDLEQLSERLVEVVDATIQPAHTSLWLKGATPQVRTRIGPSSG